MSEALRTFEDLSHSLVAAIERAIRAELTCEVLRGDIQHLLDTCIPLPEYEEQKVRADKAEADLREYGQHKRRCSVWHCANCGFTEWLHDAAEDIDEQTCARQGKTFTPKPVTECTCGFADAMGNEALPVTAGVTR